MSKRHRTALRGALLAWMACAALSLDAAPLRAQEQPGAAKTNETGEAPADSGSKDERNAQQRQVQEAAELAGRQRTDEALAKVDEALAGYQATFANEKRRINSIRQPAEALLYMAQAANDGVNAIAVEFEYGFAWYLRGYLLVELGRLDEALVMLRKAVELSPMNAQYQSELGNLHQMRKDWSAALAAYESARDASGFSPEDSKRHDEGRALRGQGFVLIEMGRLDDAEAALRQALALDPQDRGAANELEYIRQMREKAGSAKAE